VQKAHLGYVIPVVFKNKEVTVLKSLLKYASLLCFATLTLILTGCNNSDPDFDVILENGRELAIESDSFTLTNQEAFELVAESFFGLSIILDWVDEIVLAHIEIDEEILEDEREFMESFFSEEVIEEIVFSEGFNSLDEYFANSRLEMRREQAIINAIVITDEQIDEIYERIFANSDDEDDEDELDDEDYSDEEIRELIADALRDEYLLDPIFNQRVLADLRHDAGFTFSSTYFSTLYETLLESWDLDDIEVLTIDSEASIVAQIEGHYLTADALFDVAMSQFALTERTPFANHVNLNLLAEIYDVEDRVIREEIQDAKLNMLQFFYPQMESQGLHTEQQIFNFFRLSHLLNLAFDDLFGDVSAERLQELYDDRVERLTSDFERRSTPERGARHILLRESDDMTEDEAFELAEDIIAQLQDVSADEVEDLFAELAVLHGTDGTATEERGGDLGTFGLGDMVSEFQEAAFALDVNTFTTEPVESMHGFHVIYVYYIEELEEIEPLEIPTFEEIEEELTTAELNRLRNDARFLARIIFDLRETQNMRFTNDQLQTRYESLITQNRRATDQ